MRKARGRLLSIVGHSGALNAGIISLSSRYVGPYISALLRARACGGSAFGWYLRA